MSTCLRDPFTASQNVCFPSCMTAAYTSDNEIFISATEVSNQLVLPLGNVRNFPVSTPTNSAFVQVLNKQYTKLDSYKGLNYQPDRRASLHIVNTTYASENIHCNFCLTSVKGRFFPQLSKREACPR